MRYPHAPIMSDNDDTDRLLDAVRDAHSSRRALYINAGGSKRDYIGRRCDADALEIGTHTGVVDYQPRELVVTVRAGTTVSDLQAILAEEGQVLAGDPPQFRGEATVGGSLACNLSGPARPWQGSLRDAVLGLQLIDGRGQLLEFGGQVIKNVAGYDVSRLQAGALGTLGLITQVSLKVMPVAESTLTLHQECSVESALQAMRSRAREPAPLSGACWHGERLSMRLSGNADAIAVAAQRWGGERSDDDSSFWSGVRELAGEFFAGSAALWRLSLNPNTPVEPDAGEHWIDWGGAQRWLRGGSLPSLERYASRGRGHVTLFRGGDRGGEVRSRPPQVMLDLEQRIKAAFDPHGIFNPGRLAQVAD